MPLSLVSASLKSNASWKARERSTFFTFKLSSSHPTFTAAPPRSPERSESDDLASTFTSIPRNQEGGGLAAAAAMTRRIAAQVSDRCRIGSAQMFVTAPPCLADLWLGGGSKRERHDDARIVQSAGRYCGIGSLRTHAAQDDGMSLIARERRRVQVLG